MENKKDTKTTAEAIIEVLVNDIEDHIIESAEQHTKLNNIEKAIRDYHYALDIRQHGGVAQDMAIKKIESILNLPWRQGEELKNRSGEISNGN